MIGRPKLPKDQRRNKPVYVLLTPIEKRRVDKLARTQKKSRGALLREAFRKVYPHVFRKQVG